MRLPLLSAAAVILLAVLALPLASVAPIAPATATAAPILPPTGSGNESPIVGTYDCQGVEPDGTPYQGIVRIIPHDGMFDVVWTFSSGQQYSGLGVVNGDVLAVSYYTNRPGVVAYKIENGEKGPRLQGQWTVVGAGKVFVETLTRVSAEVTMPDPPPIPEHRRPMLLRHLRPA